MTELFFATSRLVVKTGRVFFRWALLFIALGL